jgi:hypothetical protein
MKLTSKYNLNECKEAAFSFAKRYFELGTSMKRLTRLRSPLSFSCGPVAQDLVDIIILKGGLQLNHHIY